MLCIFQDALGLREKKERRKDYKQDMKSEIKNTKVILLQLNRTPRSYEEKTYKRRKVAKEDYTNTRIS